MLALPAPTHTPSRVFAARRYFGLTCACNALMIGTLLFSQGLAVTQPVISLGSALAASLANWFWLEPKVTALMFDRWALSC